jgi:hypothetical protein
MVDIDAIGQSLTTDQNVVELDDGTFIQDQPEALGRRLLSAVDDADEFTKVFVRVQLAVPPTESYKARRARRPSPNWRRR